MARILLIHWKEAEIEERAEKLRAAGHEVEAWHAIDGAGALRRLRSLPPDAVLIDLARLPSHGREVAVALRMQKPTRRVPLVFVEGAQEKVARVREILPAATFANWRGIRGAVTKALRCRRADPVVPASGLAAYSKTPLPRKLGIRQGSTVALVGAPAGFETVLGDLPPDVTLRANARGRADLTLWFVTSARDLKARLPRMVPRSVGGGLWIVWPKKTSGLACELAQSVVREAGLAAGMVDFKVCRVDETWAGLRFTKRDRSPR